MCLVGRSVGPKVGLLLYLFPSKAIIDGHRVYLDIYFFNEMKSPSPSPNQINLSILNIPNRRLNIRILMPLASKQLTPQLHLLNQKSTLPSSRRVIHRAFTTRKDEQIVNERAKQAARDISDPGAPYPPRMLLREESSAVAGHQGEEAWAEVSGGIEATVPVSKTALYIK